MNSDILQGKWRQIRGYLKQTFGKFSGDDMLQAGGIADKMQGAQQERSGYTQEKSLMDYNQSAQNHSDKAEDGKTTHSDTGINSDSIVRVICAAT